MENTTKKLRGFSVLAILLLPMLWNFESACVGPALGAIAQAFPGASNLQIQLVNNMPFITSVIFSIVGGRLANIFDKKYIAVVGLFIYSVSGFLPAFANDINIILILRLITGIGVGLVLPIPNQLIVEHYEGKEREKMLGRATAAFQFSCVVISILVGILLSRSGWQVAFYTFSIVFVVLIIVLLALPKSPPAHISLKKEKIKLPGYAYFMFVANFLLWLFYGGFANTISMFVDNDKLAPMALIGIIMSIPAVASMIAGLLFPTLSRLLGRAYVFVAFAFYGLGFGCYYLTQGIEILIIGCLCIGAAVGLMGPYIINLTSLHVSEKQKDNALGLVSAGQHLGGFCSAFLMAFIMSLSAGNSFRFLYSVLFIILVLGAILSLLFNMRKKAA